MHPILFRWSDGTPFAAYALFVALGCAVGALWLRGQLERRGVAPGEAWGLALVAVGAGFLGGKLGFLLVEWRGFVQDPGGMLRDWNVGWVFWPGLLGGAVAGFAYLRLRDRRPLREFLPIADYCAPAVAIGHSIGRLGCLMEGCCHGLTTRLPWGISFTDPACSVTDGLKGMPLHPTQLYESFGEAVIAFLLIRRVLPGICAGRYRPGAAFFGYVLSYAALRFLIEFYRGDDRGALLSPILSPSQWISLLAAAVVGIITARCSGASRPPPSGAPPTASRS